MLAGLANEAAQAGKFDVEAPALLDAAWLYAQADQAHRARQPIERLQLLLRSPCLPDSTRASVNRRLYGR